jgi:5-methylcytosine-specific restriction endonuclease McrA
MPRASTYRKNPSKYAANSREYYAANRDAVLVREKERNRRRKIKRSQYRKSNRAAIAIKEKDYRVKNREAVNTRNQKKEAMMRGCKVHHTVKEWEILKALHGYSCVMCFKTEPEIKLTRDHVLPISQGGENGINNLQPMCGPCNSSKGSRKLDMRI